jgi:hypothetical protein
MLNSWFSCLPSIISLFILIGLIVNVQSFRSLIPVQTVPILDWILDGSRKQATATKQRTVLTVYSLSFFFKNVTSHKVCHAKLQTQEPVNKKYVTLFIICVINVLLYSFIYYIDASADQYFKYILDCNKESLVT